MKKTILKKASILVAIIVMLSSLTFPAFASDDYNMGNITSDTVITKDNIIDVMKFLNLDTEKLIINPQEQTQESNLEITVGDLMRAIEREKSMIPEVRTSQDFVHKDTNQTIRPFAASERYTTTYSTTNKYSSYSLTVSTPITLDLISSGLRLYERFVSTGAPSGSLSDTINAGVFRKITKSHCSATLNNAGTMATVYASFVVTSYFGVDFFSVPINAVSHEGSYCYYAKTYN